MLYIKERSNTYGASQFEMMSLAQSLSLEFPTHSSIPEV